MLFYCCSCSFIVENTILLLKMQFTTGNAVLSLEMQFYCWKYYFTPGMQFYYSFIAENAVLLQEINFCLKIYDFIVKIN
jgi:hypothetical protein